MGVPVNPLEAYAASGYEKKIRDERGVHDSSGGFQ
jgi:L-rhamnose isomerase